MTQVEGFSGPPLLFMEGVRGPFPLPPPLLSPLDTFFLGHVFFRLSLLPRHVEAEFPSDDEHLSGEPGSFPSFFRLSPGSVLFLLLGMIALHCNGLLSLDAQSLSTSFFPMSFSHLILPTVPFFCSSMYKSFPFFPVRELSPFFFFVGDNGLDRSPPLSLPCEALLSFFRSLLRRFASLPPFSSPFY